MNKITYLRFLACFIIDLITLYNLNSGSFNIYLEMLIESVKREKINR